MATNTILLQAQEEIKDILRKHNIAGAIILHTPGHGHWFVHLNPTYSCVYILDDNEVRIYSKKEDYNSAEEQIQKQEDSSNMLKILTDGLVFAFQTIHSLSRTLDETVGATHTDVKPT